MVKDFSIEIFITLMGLFIREVRLEVYWQEITTPSDRSFLLGASFWEVKSLELSGLVIIEPSKLNFKVQLICFSS
jgi:hypothetical protein